MSIILNPSLHKKYKLQFYLFIIVNATNAISIFRLSVALFAIYFNFFNKNTKKKKIPFFSFFSFLFFSFSFLFFLFLSFSFSLLSFFFLFSFSFYSFLEKKIYLFILLIEKKRARGLPATCWVFLQKKRPKGTIDPIHKGVSLFLSYTNMNKMNGFIYLFIYLFIFHL